MAIRAVSQQLAQLRKTFTFNQTMIRVKDPAKSLNFYQKYFDMKLISQRDLSDFSLYFLITAPEGHKIPKVNTPEAVEYLKSGAYGCCLELTHNHGTESDPTFSYHSGNTDPKGFGHVAFLVDDLEGACQTLMNDGVKFHKKPSDGKRNYFAFAEDPDGYWVELMARSASSPVKGRPTYNHTMLRVKDPKKSIEFYETVCGFTKVHELHVPEDKFSLYFLGTFSDDEKRRLLPKDSETQEAHEFVFGHPGQFVELIHYHGTESDDSFRGYHSGNTVPRGFGHIAIMVDDVFEASKAMEESGVEFQKKPDEGRMKGLAFIKDPDGYWVEIVKRSRKDQ